MPIANMSSTVANKKLSTDEISVMLIVSACSVPWPANGCATNSRAASTICSAPFTNINTAAKSDPSTANSTMMRELNKIVSKTLSSLDCCGRSIRAVSDGSFLPRAVRASQPVRSPRGRGTYGVFREPLCDRVELIHLHRALRGRGDDEREGAQEHASVRCRIAELDERFGPQVQRRAVVIEHRQGPTQRCVGRRVVTGPRERPRKQDLHPRTLYMRLPARRAAGIERFAKPARSRDIVLLHHRKRPEVLQRLRAFGRTRAHHVGGFERALVPTPR